MGTAQLFSLRNHMNTKLPPSFPVPHWFSGKTFLSAHNCKNTSLKGMARSNEGTVHSLPSSLHGIWNSPQHPVNLLQSPGHLGTQFGTTAVHNKCGESSKEEPNYSRETSSQKISGFQEEEKLELGWLALLGEEDRMQACQNGRKGHGQCAGPASSHLDWLKTRRRKQATTYQRGS